MVGFGLELTSRSVGVSFNLAGQVQCERGLRSEDLGGWGDLVIFFRTSKGWVTIFSKISKPCDISLKRELYFLITDRSKDLISYT